jgi:hypothetical protein
MAASQKEPIQVKGSETFTNAVLSRKRLKMYEMKSSEKVMV